MAVVLVVSETQGSLAGGLNIFVLLVVLGVYSYRDIYPLATYSQEPADIREGKVLWGKIFTLTMASLIIPLFTPRPYVPVDLKVCIVLRKVWIWLTACNFVDRNRCLFPIPSRLRLGFQDSHFRI